MSEHAIPADLDSQGHRPGCPHYGKAEMEPDDPTDHIDIFCDCHDWTEPLILPSGTDIAWPFGWDLEMATEWRAKHGLSRPDRDQPGSPSV
jgi:hypothetical protein